jgi:hypothetical protein
MAIRKTRGARYEIDFRDADGMRHQKTFDRRSEAERAHNQVRRDVWAGNFVSPRKARTFSEVAMASSRLKTRTLSRQRAGFACGPDDDRPHRESA